MSIASLPRILLLACCALFVVGCDDDLGGPTGQPGTLSGYVTLYRDSGEKLDDASSVTVTVEGTAFSAQTDTRGHWEITNLPPGTYILSFTKSGYGEQKVFDKRFVGGGESYAPKVQLFAEMNYGTITITMATVTTVNENDHAFHDFRIEGTVGEAVPYARALRLFLGTDAGVSDREGTSFHEPGTIVPAGATTFTFTRRYGVDEFNALGPTGPAYVVAYPPMSSSRYYDPRVDSTVVTGRRNPPSAVVQMVFQ